MSPCEVDVMSTGTTILIDKLLHTVVSRNASDLHLAVGSPPVVRVDGRLMRLETKELGSEDTVGLMKSITPERCQQELQEVGGTDFGFAFGDVARFRVSVFKQRGCVGIVLRQLPNRLMDFKGDGHPAGVGEADHAAAWSDSGDRPDGVGKDDDAGGGGGLHQPQDGPAHHHD